MKIPYPPWVLCGYGLQVIQITKVSEINLQLNPSYKIIQLIPGYTVSLISCGSFNDKSSVSYNELIICPALVKFKGKVGFYISNIYVDSSLSVEGGKRFWKLNKKRAQFKWINKNKVLISTPEGNISLRVNRIIPFLMPGISLRAFVSSKKYISSFTGRITTLLHIGKAKVSDMSAYFEGIGIKKTSIGFVLNNSKMIAYSPDLVHNISNE